MHREEEHTSSLAELTARLRGLPPSPKPPISFQSVSHLIVTAVVLIAAVGGYVAYKRHEDTRVAQQRAARQAQFISRISELATKNDAATDWQKAISTLGNQRKIYTAELQTLLVRHDGRPVLVFASLQNVGDSHGRTVLYLDDAARLESNLKLQLDSTPDQKHLVMSSEPPHTFAVVARIRSVEYVVGSDSSLATGDCVDLMPVSASDYVEFVLGAELEKLSHHAGT